MSAGLVEIQRRTANLFCQKTKLRGLKQKKTKNMKKKQRNKKRS